MLQDRKCKYKCNNVELSRNHCCRGKAKNISYSECVSAALVIQCAMCMSCTIFVCGSNIFFPHYLISGTIFGGKKY